ncbi:MAG: HD-GYP domain-containing protein [Gemmatimonadaceae bacterium]|nr:HD-GYP domain-containing protein [Gemmatimonadaceae bacterium]
MVVATALFGVMCFVALYSINPGIDPREREAAIAFAVFSVFGALMPYALSDKTSGNATFVTFLASVVLAPSWVTVVSAVSVVFVSQLLQRKDGVKTLFNVGQHAVALSISVLAFRATGASGAVFTGDIRTFPLVVAFLAFVVANSTAVAAVVSAETQKNFWTLWKEGQRGFLFDMVALPFVYVFVRVYIDYGVLATSAAAALVLIVRQLNSTNEELHLSNKELLELTVTTLEARDPYTSGHSRRVSQYSRMMGQALGLTAKQVDRLTVAGLLHDVGKIHEVFAPILSKPGKLTAEERAIMESHPIKGAELVRISSHLRDTVEPIRHHHEAWDGSGYPDALAGESIPVFARIIAIADTIDAMASDRPYRRGLSAEKIRAEIVRMSGIQFDPQMLRTLLSAGTIDTVLRLACASHEDGFAAEPTLSLLANG